jgi:hypothetical protein
MAVPRGAEKWLFMIPLMVMPVREAGFASPSGKETATWQQVP